MKPPAHSHHWDNGWGNLLMVPIHRLWLSDISSLAIDQDHGIIWQGPIWAQKAAIDVLRFEYVDGLQICKWKTNVRGVLKIR